MGPRLRNSIFVYMDILGYVAYLRGLDTRAGQEAALSVLLGAMQEAQERWTPHPDWADDKSLVMKSKVFTDNVLLAYYISDDGEGELGRLWGEVAQHQMALIEHGLLIRGGIAEGLGYFDGDMAFGMPLIDAVTIEESVAVFPRVVLSDEVLQRALNHTSFYTEPTNSPQASEVVRDEDDRAFVNYLGPWRWWDREPHLAFLDTHRKHAARGLDKFTELPRVRAKYQWLCGYHNWAVQQYAPDHKKTELLIGGVSPRAIKWIV